MLITTNISSRDLNQDTGSAKKAARRGPVIVTDRGRPAYVLLSIEQYQALTAPAARIVDLLGMPDAAGVHFNPPRLRKLSRPTTSAEAMCTLAPNGSEPTSQATGGR